MLVLRELAVSAPTFFFQQVQPFFDNIFYAVWDPKQAIREGAVSALRACLILTTQRETKEMQKPQWYKARQLSCKCSSIWSLGKMMECIFLSSWLANIWGGGERLWRDSGQGKRNESWWSGPRCSPHPEWAGSHQQHGRRGEGEFTGLLYWRLLVDDSCLSHLCDSACVRKWRKSHSSNWSMINTARSWWDLGPSLATSHLSQAFSLCSHSSLTPSWACWATALLKASSPSGLHRRLPRPLW